MDQFSPQIREESRKFVRRKPVKNAMPMLMLPVAAKRL